MIFIILLLLIIFIYLSPLIFYRLSLKKVNLTVKSLEGKSLTQHFLLEKDDPLWEIIEQYKKSIHDPK